MYVRRADKSKEMKLPPFSRFSDAAELLWEGGYMNKSDFRGTNIKMSMSTDMNMNISMNPNDEGDTNRNGNGNGGRSSVGSRSKPVIFIGTEDTSVLKEAMEWGKKKGYQVSTSVHARTVYDLFEKVK